MPRAWLARRVLEQAGEDLNRQIVRQKRGEDLFLGGLELVDAARATGRRRPASAGTGKGMSCCAVTIWVIADLKR